MIKYEELQVEREYSKYPKGLRHYSKDRVFENSLFDLELIKYKIASLVKGQSNGKEDNTRHKAENKETAREVLYRTLLGLLHKDRHTANSKREIDTITGRYIALDESQRQEHKESDSKCEEEAETQKNEDRG